MASAAVAPVFAHLRGGFDNQSHGNSERLARFSSLAKLGKVGIAVHSGSYKPITELLSKWQAGDETAVLSIAAPAA